MPVFTFLECYDFSGKTLVLFCTSGSTGIGASVSDIREVCPNAEVPSGLRANDTSAVAPWLAQWGR